MSDDDYDFDDDYDDEYLDPHRGSTILVLGILSLVFCVILGIIAWVMGNHDLEEMRAGRMDPSGEGMTQAGRICGIISVVLNLVGIVLAFFVFALAGGAVWSAR